MSAKTKGTRVFIIVIVGAFLLSSIGFSALVVWELTRNKDDTSDVQRQLEEQLANQQEEQQMNNEPLDGYNAEVFDKAKVTELKIEKLVEGSGKTASAKSTVKANYFGWTSDGKIFDSSKKDGQAEPVEFSLNEVIPGWTEGLSGISEGSVVKLTIPADKAYGENGSPPVIGPNEPLMFIVKLIQVK